MSFCRVFFLFKVFFILPTEKSQVLNETFPNSTFLANGLIHGLKVNTFFYKLFTSNLDTNHYTFTFQGILSFLSAPLIGALSDIWGRKVFLLITVFFTCLPIPLMRINTMWYFAMISISGLFAVTFSVVFAYVADVTDESNRTTAYGLVRKHLQSFFSRKSLDQCILKLDFINSGLSYIRCQSNHESGAGLLPEPLLQREFCDRSGHRHSHIRFVFHTGGRARVTAGENPRTI